MIVFKIRISLVSVLRYFTKSDYSETDISLG